MLDSTLDSLIDEVSEMKNEVVKYRKLAFRHKFSLSFITSLEDAFACSICRATPARPPLIACSACSTLVGCENCTNEWYKDGSLEKRCPKWRAERGLTKTFILRGFDGVVSQIEQMNHSDEKDNPDDVDLEAVELD